MHQIVRARDRPRNWESFKVVISMNDFDSVCQVVIWGENICNFYL